MITLAVALLAFNLVATDIMAEAHGVFNFHYWAVVDFILGSLITLCVWDRIR